MTGKKNRKKREKARKPGVNTPEVNKQKIDDILKEIKGTDEPFNIPKTLLKKEEWGLLTIMNLLLAGVFPAYFVNILLISFFTEIGHFWTTHLTELERKRLVDFEKDFRKGYELEEKRKWKEAVKVYESLIPRYKDNPKISKIATDRIEWIEKKQMKKGR